MSNERTFTLIEHERERLADLADGLTPVQWDTPSLADGWRVREVVTHLTMPFSVSLPRMVLGLARHGGSFDRLADHWARDEAVSTDPAEVTARLRANAGARFTPPGMGAEAPLTDVVVHGLDVRLPLDLPTDDLDRDAVGTVLRFLTTGSARRFGVPADAFTRNRFEATDLDWAHGTGAVERASAVDVIAHLCRARPLAPQG